jgi:GNAT superfamily N-acetyltransferase
MAEQPARRATRGTIGQVREGSNRSTIRQLGLDDLDAILALQRLARDSLADPSLLADDPPEFFVQHLASPNRIDGIDRDGKLIAFAVLGLQMTEAENFGSHLGLPADRLARVAQLDGAVVAPAHRSSGLHARLVRWRIARALEFGCRDVLSTAAPRNIASWRNMVRFDLHAVALRYLFGGLPRFVLHRDLDQPRRLDHDAAEVSPLEPERLQAAFAAGLVGVAVAPGGIWMAPLVKET